MPTAVEQLNQETIDLVKAVFGRTDQGLEKAITTSTGLVGYNLEAPAKRLYPVLSPLRNRIARTKAPVGSIAANWRSIIGINTQRIKAAVAFGTRNAEISYATVDRSAAYKTFGLDDSVQDEAIWLGRGFEDVRALSALATLQSVMIEEEKLILGGNVTALGAPAAPTVVVANTTGGSGWSTAAGNAVYAKVVALPLYGWLNSALNDLTQNLADHSAPSNAGSVANTNATAVIDVTWPAHPAAFAYAVFIAEGTSAPANSAYKLAAITTELGVRLTSPPSSGNAALSNNATDTSGDVNAFDGIFPQILPVGATLSAIDSTNSSGVLKKVTGGTPITGALVYDMNFSNGAGATLTPDNAGGIVEFDVILKALWDEHRIGPTLILVHSQEAKNITQKIGGSSNLAYRIELRDGQKDVVGGIYVSAYLNKFSSSLTPGAPDAVPIMIHPYAVPGTVLFLSERLPYPNNQVPNVLEMEMQQEYADFEWARVQRKYEHGVYAMGVLKHYFPAGCAVIRGVRNG